ncbi:MAG: NnrS family protein, partial [Thalassobaculaceae bacterium]
MAGLLTQGLRPFFLAAALFAAAAVPLWTLGAWRSESLLDLGFDLVWHSHEMLFGFTGAVITGFTLTAVPNWTGRPALTGGLLALLAGLWLVTRLAAPGLLATGAWSGLLLALFPLVLAGHTAREIVAGKTWRNLPIAGLIALLAGADLWFLATHASAGDSAPAARLGLAALIALITVIGGRIVPAFTANWLAARQIPTARLGPGVDRVALALTGAALAAWVGWPDAVLTGYLALGAGLVNALRWARWRGWRCLAEPLIFGLHLGYLWLAVGWGLTAAAILWVPSVTHGMAQHAFTAGTIGHMTLVVMSRAVLGHNGLPLEAGRLLSAAVAAVFIGALLRVTGNFAGPVSGPVLMIAAGLWSLAFLLFF